MSVIKPLTKITSIREHGLQALNRVANKHGVSNIHLLTCIVLHVSLLSSDDQLRILDDGESIDLMVRMGCRLDEHGKLDYSHLFPIKVVIEEDQ
ncbi:hypothetical protein LCGC14_2486030 [marine sediment metagenome]|uniref:Uncharacterized protein n=1 Tax=marine sediment metagenome TaxID=412755 RepID=A0A0F9DI34_9ZZZZ